MDIQYVLSNTLIYGVIALILASFFSFGKVLNMSLGGFLAMSGYIIYSIVTHGFGRGTAAVIVCVVALFLLVNRGLLKYFPNDKQRDHVGIVLTMGVNMVVENAVSYIYGPNSVSLNLVHFPRYVLLLIFIVLSVLIYYFFKYTLHGITFKAISEHGRIVKSLGIRSDYLLQILFAVLFVFLVCVAFIILNQTGLRATDGIFYIVKGIGIMLLVGLDKKEYILLGALLYVLVEYLLFIQRGLPISYKETLILVIIVLVLLFKPEGLFSLKKRHI